jgi:hypothetical protein
VRASGIILIVALLLPLSWAIDENRIGVLFIGDPMRAPGFDFMRTEPIFSLTFVAASLRGFGGWEIDDVHRAIRLYLPRNYQDIVSRFDTVVLDNANRHALTDKQIDLLARVVEEARVGLFMAGGDESFGGYNYPPWGQTSIGELLPTGDIEQTWVVPGRLVVDEEDHEFMSSIPWERRSPFMEAWQHNLVTTKPGSQLLAHTVQNRYYLGGDMHPLLITWELNGARVFACTGEVTLLAIYLSYQGVNYVPWEYYGDFSSNLMIYLAKRPVPQDVDLVHAARSKAFETRTRISLLLNLIEFIEDFGANTNGLMRSLDAVNQKISSITEMYLELSFGDVLEAYDDLDLVLDGIEEDAVEIKNMSLLWVYIIEWLAVTAAALISGFTLWSTMVKRKLYQEVEATRMMI